jgi:hypothetical protein
MAVPRISSLPLLQPVEGRLPSDILYNPQLAQIALSVQTQPWDLRSLSPETCSLLIDFDLPDNMITEQVGRMETWYSAGALDWLLALP